MRHLFLAAAFVCAAFFSAAQQYTYPVLPTGADTINQFGYSIPDPFRSLEELDSKQTKDWLAQQEEMVRKYRNSVFSEYTITERELALSYMGSRSKTYTSQKIGAFYFTVKQSVSFDNAPTIQFKTKRSNGWDDFLITGQFLKSKTDVININNITVSDNDSLVVVSISHGGSDWQEVIIVQVAGKKVLADKLQWVKGDVDWCKDGFVYQQYDKPDGDNHISSFIKNSAIYYHVIGTDFKSDIALSVSNENDKRYSVIAKGKYVVIYEQKEISGKSAGTFSYIKSEELGRDSLRCFLMLPGITDRTISIVDEHNGMFLAKSNHKAPKGKVMLYDYTKVNQGKQLIEMFNQNLLSVHSLNSKVICIYMEKGNNICLVFDSVGGLIKRIDVPPAASIEGFNKVYKDSITYYYVSTFTSPRITLKFNLNTFKSSLPEEDAELSIGSVNTTEVVSFRSADSTEIYMYLIHNEKVKPNGNNPVLLYAYGGFGVAQRPHFDFTYNMLLEKGAVIAIPLIRGGGEFGADWHNAGRKKNKQKSVDDVIAATKWLIENRYTNPQRIALTGGSQGGWLMAETMTQKPELFKVVVPVAGVYDLLRFHKYSITGAIGYDEFGNPEDSTEFQYLAKISPYHHIKSGVRYPACMLFSGVNDDRVVPFHSYKLLAALQKDRNGPVPYLLYSEENAGHNVSNAMEGFQQISLKYTFIMQMLGMKFY
ncbi:MAG TPA: prolyl oligopeptidase family serine peptidase [Chitinophagales bacterium]|nr:prolyl oligopeptidase family serine peptidase [Chitinophagales bacterium]